MLFGALSHPTVVKPNALPPPPPQLDEDSKLARDAREKANEARSSAEQASSRVDNALKVVQNIALALQLAGDTSIDSSELDELERRLEDAERTMEEEELPKRIEALRANRTEQERMVRGGEREEGVSGKGTEDIRGKFGFGAESDFYRIYVLSRRLLQSIVPVGRYSRNSHVFPIEPRFRQFDLTISDVRVQSSFALSSAAFDLTLT